MKEKIVIIGASSGIGSSLARLVVEKGHSVGLAARRTKPLDEIRSVAPDRVFFRRMDVMVPNEVKEGLEALKQDLGGLDWMVYSSGVGTDDKFLTPEALLPTVYTNVAGFISAFGYTVQLMKDTGGQIAGISSVMEARGSTYFPTYSASKSFMSAFMEGARRRVRRWNIDVCDIRPGFIRTPMTEDNPRKFLVSDADTAARYIYLALKKHKSVAYIPPWWRPFSWLTRHAPEWVIKLIKY